MKLDLNKVRKIAKYTNWIEIDHQENIKTVSFIKYETEIIKVKKKGLGKLLWFWNVKFETKRKKLGRINVYYSTGTVGTAINHPVQGKTQMFRKNVSIEELGFIFKDPRIHTGKGYKKKKKL